MIADTTCYEANVFDKRPDQSGRTGAIVHVAKPLAIVDAAAKWNTWSVWHRITIPTGPVLPVCLPPYVIEHPTATVRVDVVPKHAEVFVDGYFAGTSDRVQTTPDGHMITLFEPGYRTVTQSIYVAPGATVKLHSTMDWLPAGETSAPPPRPTTPPFAGTPDQG